MLFADATVLCADGSVKEHTWVGVRDKRIACVAEMAPAGDWGEEMDAREYVLMPGLVNSHTHVPMTLLRGYGENLPLDRWLYERIFPFEDKLTGEDVYWGSLLGIAEMLASGTTSFTDMYYFCDRIAQAAAESGIKANIGRGISCFDPTQRFFDLPAFGETNALLYEVHGADDGRLLVDVAPHSEYTTRPDILADAAELAAKHHARMHIHVSETEKEQRECVARHGKTPVGVLLETGVLKLPVTLAHGVWLTDGDMETLAAHDVTVAHCPKSNCKLGSGIARVHALQQAGVPVSLGTDSASSNNALDMLEELRFASLLAKGVTRDSQALPAADALYMATRAGALSQGRPDCGDVREGYRADLVLLDRRRTRLNPMHDVPANAVYAADAAAVAMTMVDGRVLYRDGRFLTIDIERVRAEVTRCVDGIQTRLNG